MVSACILSVDMPRIGLIVKTYLIFAATPPRYEFGIASLSNKKELLQVDDPLTFQV